MSIVISFFFLSKAMELLSQYAFSRQVYEQVLLKLLEQRWY